MSATVQTGHSWDTVVRNFAENVGILEPSQVYNQIERLRAALLQQGIDLTTQRQHLTPEEMTPINRVLCPVEVQLIEGEEGMEITSAPYTGEPCASDEALVNAGFVFCWLLSTNVDVRTVDIDGTTLLKLLPSALKIGLSSNATVRKIKVGLWSEETEKHGACLADGLHAGLPLEVYNNHGVELSDQSAARVSDVLKQCKATLEAVSMGSGPQPGPSQGNIKLLLEALIGARKLSSIYLSSYDLGKEGGEILAEVLRTSSTLKKLSIQQPADEALDFLVDGLRASSSLEELAIWQSYNSSGRIALPIADFMRRNSSIRNLNLAGMNIDVDGARALADMLTENRTLKDLNLEMNKIGNEGAAVFADAMRVNNTLETLNLSGNDIDGDNTCALIKALQENKSIKRLHLYPGVEAPSLDVVCRVAYRLENAGLQELTRALENGAVVEKLNVSWDEGFSPLYVGQLFSAIGTNNSIRELSIDGSAGYIDPYAAGHLSHTFASSTSLRTVHFSYEFEDPNVVMSLFVGLSRNKSIREINFGHMSLAYRPVPKVLRNLLNANSTLRSFSSYDSNIHAKDMTPILEGLAENYTLTGLDLGQLSEPGDELLQVQELIRRNRKLLKCAVQFVFGKQRDDKAREAYRKLSSSVSLIEEIMKLRSLSPDAARELVLSAGVCA
ncbi:NLR family CARD domain-containing protein 3-like [Ornithodoros turicata]|uniref:NLR family CARD domain-containing protein 3-like n=1 Tax=Ornithodoros turicata TaxID=34597 RepID=UPI00313A028E